LNLHSATNPDPVTNPNPNPKSENPVPDPIPDLELHPELDPKLFPNWKSDSLPELYLVKDLEWILKRIRKLIQTQILK
jgi:hypothetical protein